VIFGKNQIKKLLSIIEAQHLVFIASNIGGSVLTDSDKTVLKNHGIDFKQFLNNDEETFTSQAFKFGVLAESLGDERARNLTYVDFKSYLTRGEFIPLTKEEQFAIASVKDQAYHDIKGLSNKVGEDVTQIHREEYEKIVEDAALTTVKKREGAGAMSLRIGAKTDDWDRDLGRISEYVMHSVYEEGRATSLQSRKGKNVKVFKDVFPGSCRYCIQHYLTSGIGSEPVIFNLSELRANGTNIGRKAPNWLPVLGSMHPWCRCTLGEFPEDRDWNKKTRSFDILKEFKRKVERKSKIKIEVGKQKFEV